MLNNFQSILRRTLGFSSEKLIGENEAAFTREIAFTNFVRMRTMAKVALTVFAFLWFWDIFQFFDGKWQLSIGYQIITLFHSLLLIFLTGLLILAWKKSPGNPDSIKPFHTKVTKGSLAFVMICTLFLAFGDAMTNGSIAAYLGMIFAYSAIFILESRYCLILFGSNMIAIVFLLAILNFQSGKSMDIQIINAVAFTIVAFVLSRVLFLYSLRDFSNRLVILEQADEIKQQSEVKEELIKELKSALDEVKTLSGFLPICATCKKIRDDRGYWKQIEGYIQEHSDAQFSHGICPECAEKMYGDQDWYQKRGEEK